MADVKDALSEFTLRSGLNVEKVLEHRVVEWSEDEKEELLTLRVSGKRHPAFVLFDSGGVRKWGFILPCARYGLKNETDE